MILTTAHCGLRSEPQLLHLPISLSFVPNPRLSASMPRIVWGRVRNYAHGVRLSSWSYTAARWCILLLAFSCPNASLRWRECGVSNTCHSRVARLLDSRSSRFEKYDSRCQPIWRCGIDQPLDARNGRPNPLRSRAVERWAQRSICKRRWFLAVRRGAHSERTPWLLCTLLNRTCNASDESGSVHFWEPFSQCVRRFRRLGLCCHGAHSEWHSQRHEQRTSTSFSWWPLVVWSEEFSRPRA